MCTHICRCFWHGQQSLEFMYLCALSGMLRLSATGLIREAKTRPNQSVQFAFASGFRLISASLVVKKASVAALDPVKKSIDTNVLRRVFIA